MQRSALISHLASPCIARIVLCAIGAAVTEVHVLWQNAVALVDGVEQTVGALVEISFSVLTVIVPLAVARVAITAINLTDAVVFWK